MGGVCMGTVEQKRGWVLGTDRQDRERDESLVWI